MPKIAIITARGGSKRIPKKNIKEFCGEPIIAYSIKAALESKIFDEVMVSTDSPDIATVAREYGAEVPFLRSKENSNDYASTAEVIVEVLSRYGEAGKYFEAFACIYPTAPFVTGKKLGEAIELLDGADSVITVVKYSFPPQRAFLINGGNVSYQYPQYANTRSQDLEPIYHDCGQFYICKTDMFLKHHSLILPKTKPYIIPEEEVQDIDTMSDWVIAEAKYMALRKEG